MGWKSKYKSKYFSPAETACKCGCGMQVQDTLLEVADAVREKFGEALVVTSGARCPAYNKKVGGAPASTHQKGLALDLSCTDSGKRMRLLKAMLEVGVRRVGLGKTFLHMDVGSDGYAQDVAFNY